MRAIQTGWRESVIHESSPSDRATSPSWSSSGALHLYAVRSEGATGSVNPTLGYRCENVANQTFPEESFDLRCEQDVFEHVPDPTGSIR
jgi:hypothetical protein